MGKMRLQRLQPEFVKMRRRHDGLPFIGQETGNSEQRQGSKMNYLRFSMIGVLLIGAVRMASAQELPDAKKVIKRLAEASASQPEENTQNPLVQLVANTRAYRDQVDELSPEESAKRWLSLLDDVYRVNKAGREGGLGQR